MEHIGKAKTPCAVLGLLCFVFSICIFRDIQVNAAGEANMEVMNHDPYIYTRSSTLEDVINDPYFVIQEMPIVSSRYWNMVHGANAKQVKQDEEGLYTMRVLGRNMAYMLKCQEAARRAGVSVPEQETPVFTNFIR